MLVAAGAGSGVCGLIYVGVVKAAGPGVDGAESGVELVVKSEKDLECFGGLECCDEMDGCGEDAGGFAGGR